MYTNRDLWAGFRVFRTGARWIGYEQLALGLPFVSGEHAEAELLPADVMEFDGLPDLYRGFSCGGAPLFPAIVSFDALYYSRPVHEFLTRRYVAPVVPEKVIRGRTTHRSWRTDEFDEDHLRRCPGCGGPCNQAVAGGGLHMVRGVPIIKARCVFPVSPACSGLHVLPCEREWLKLTALTPVRAVYQTLRALHSTPEATHHRDRQRHRAAANSVVDRLPRVGLPAQRLRKQASMLLNWVRLCLRNDWLDSIRAPIKINETAPVLVSGRQLRDGAIVESGIGSAHLRRLLDERRASGADLPYGRGLETFERWLDSELGR